MPELPEVHTISSDLNKYIKGYKVINVKVVGNYKVLPGEDIFKEKLRGSTIAEVTRLAKNILFKLESENYLLVHLAMTGQILLTSLQSKMPNWTRVVLQLEKNGDKKVLFFTDMRMFGKIGVINTSDYFKLKEKYGPEPLSNITAEKFLEQVRSKRTNIKNVLLNQSIVSGLGNIYATDALFLAGIHPETPSQQIRLPIAEKLIESARQVLKEGIEHRGSTLPDRMYVDIFGKEGSHQHHFKIYGKKICPNCGTTVENKKISGRSTFFCPVCQPLENQTKLL